MVKNLNKGNIGIIAYGSLIDDPGEELGPLIVNRTACETPFKVEYGRLSRSRGGAPTLIPVTSGGSTVKGCLLILNAEVSLPDAMSMLWRRETRMKEKPYVKLVNPGRNSVVVESVSDFADCKTVLYTRIGSNIPGEITAKKLANYAIDSISTNAGSHKMDGLRYLSGAIENGINTPLTAKFLAEILKHTPEPDLSRVISKLDSKRSIDRFLGYLENKDKVDHLAVAEKIRGVARLDDKLKIYLENYSFIKANGRIYTRNAVGNDTEKIICNCHNCRQQSDFLQGYGVYEPFLEAEAVDLGLFINSDLPYLDKLKVWHFVTGGASSISFDFKNGHRSLALRPRNESEIKIENRFCYEMILANFFKNESSMPQLFEKDFETRHEKFSTKFSNSLYQEEFLNKTITAVRDNTEGLRDDEANAIFNRLVEGETVNLGSKVIEYGEMFKQVIAYEEYLYLKFLEETKNGSVKRSVKRVEKSVGPIHFEDRSSTEFERLVFAYLLKTNHWDSLEWLGESGNDGGRDIWGIMAGDTYCFQCANYRRITKKKAQEDIDKLVVNKRIPVNWILYCGGKVGNQVREATKSYGMTAGIKTIDIYSGGEFEELLRHRTPSLIKRFVEGEIFPEPEIPDFAEVNNSMVVLVKGMFRDWLHHEVVPSTNTLYSIFKNVSYHQLSNIEMVYLILVLNELNPDFDLDDNGEETEFSFDHFYIHLANSATYNIPVLSPEEQDYYQIRYNSFETMHSSRSTNLPVNCYSFHAFHNLEDGRKIEVFFTKGFDLQIELRIGVSM